jgi:hypothetical protein
MGLIRFVQTHNRNKELKNMRKLKEQELDVLEHKELDEMKKNPRKECELCWKLKDMKYLKEYEVHGRGMFLCKECGDKVTGKSKKISETEDEALNILRSRYAKGEITKEQYEQMKKDLE